MKWEKSHKELLPKEVEDIIEAGPPEECTTKNIYYKCCPKLVNLEDLYVIYNVMHNYYA